MVFKLVKDRRKNINELSDSKKPIEGRHPGRGSSQESKQAVIRERVALNRDSGELNFESDKDDSSCEWKK